MEKEKDITHLVGALYGCINKYGIKRVMSKIGELNEPSVDKKIKKFIIDTVCEVYDVNLSDMTKPYIRNSGGRKTIEARNMCFLQIKKHLRYSHQDIANLFGKSSHVMVSNAIKEYEEMEGVIKPEIEYINNYENISNKIIGFKNKIIK